MVPVFKEPYRETVEMGQTKLKHTGAQWNPVWQFMVLGWQAKQNKTEKTNFGQLQQKYNWQVMGCLTRWKNKTPTESINLEDAGQLGRCR